MLLGAADLIDRPMGDSKVNLVGRRTRRLGGEAQIPEQGLGDPVMTLVLQQGSAALVRQTALPAEPGDQAKLLERTEVGERGRRSNPESRGDLLEARTPSRALPRGDDPKGFDLAMGQLLEGLHVASEESTVYIGHSNY
jgi:hypothetical protein